MIRALLLLPMAAAVLSAPVAAEQRRFALAGFDRVAVAGSDDVVIRQGPFSVTADGASGDLDQLEIKVEKGVLKISRKNSLWSWRSREIRLSVALPALHGLSVAGSSDVNADRGGGDQFALRVAGSGNVALAALDARAAIINIAGSGDVTAAGRCGALTLRVAGSGNAALAGLRCTNAAISVAGSGDAAAHVQGLAEVSVAGSGNVNITGGARCASKIVGSGEVSCG